MPQQFNETALNPGNNNSLQSNGDNSYSTTTSDNHTVSVTAPDSGYNASYNIPPTSTGVIIYMTAGDSDYNYVIEPLKFGMLPIWAKPKDSQAVKKGTGFGREYSREVQTYQGKMFNCRKETVAQNKSTWVQPRKQSRCVVPIQGYFEWHKTAKDKVPYFVYLKTSPIIYLAGLYAHNTHYNDTGLVDKGTKFFSSFAIATGPGVGKSKSNDLSWLHSRKPIMLKPNSKEWFEWLVPNNEWNPDLLELALNTDTNPAYDDLASYVVAKTVGNPTNKDKSVLKEVKSKQPSIAQMFGKRDEKVKSLKEEHASKPEKKDIGKVVKGEPEQSQKFKEEDDADDSKHREAVKRAHDGLSSVAKRVKIEHEGSEVAMKRYAEDSDQEDESE